MPKDAQIAVRITADESARLDRFVDRLGGTISKAAAARLALARGLVRLESEHASSLYELVSAVDDDAFRGFRESHARVFELRRASDGATRFVRCSISNRLRATLDQNHIPGGKQRAEYLDAFYRSQLNELVKEAFAAGDDGAGVIRMFDAKKFDDVARIARDFVGA